MSEATRSGQVYGSLDRRVERYAPTSIVGCKHDLLTCDSAWGDATWGNASMLVYVGEC